MAVVIHSRGAFGVSPVSKLVLSLLLFVAGSIALPPSTAVAASKLPAGELMDVRPVQDDDALLCSFYLKSGKFETALMRFDGKKQLNKPYWTRKLIKKTIVTLNETIKNGSSLSAKKLKKAKSDKKALQKSQKQIAECEKAEDPRSPQSIVEFKHIKPILETQCLKCHNVLGWTNEQSFFMSTGRVVPNNLEASPLYTYLSNNPEGFQPGYMPKGLTPISDLDIMLIARWIKTINSFNPNLPTPTPTPSGELGEARATYNSICSGCHGLIDVSAKAGKTEAQIRNALLTIPQMRNLVLSDDQIRKIALALGSVSPPREGTVSVRTLSATSEGNPGGVGVTMQFEISLTGTTSQPFTVGYVTSNDTALADSDFEFSAGTVEFQGIHGEKHIVAVNLIPDSNEERDETFTLDIGGISYGGVRIDVGSAIGTILNDDVFTQNLPAQSSKLRVAYGFNGDYADAVGLGDAVAVGDAVISSAAKVGSGSVELDEGADQLTVPARPFMGMTDFTLSTWVYWTNATSTTTRIIDFGSSASNYLYFTPKDSTNRCRFEIRTTNGTFLLQCNTGVALPANRWVHLATTFNSVTDEMKIFIDGQQAATRTGVTLVLSTLTANDNKIGKSRVAGNVDFAGRLDEMTVWDAALTAAEIAQVMAMTQTISVTAGMEVRLNNQLVTNGGVLDLGAVEIGQVLDLPLVITNAGVAGLGLTGAPLVQIGGQNSTEFKAQYQPWPWQELIGTGSVATFMLRYTPTSPGTKTATLIVPNSDMRNGNFAVALKAIASGTPLPEPPPPSGNDTPLVQGQFLYAANCSGCHGVLVNSQKRGASLATVTAALNPSTGIPQMRSLSLSSAQIDMIVLALNSPPPTTGSTERVSNSVTNLGTAPYVASAFRSIFLPDDATTYNADDTSINVKIWEQVMGVRPDFSVGFAGRVSAFGGRCDRFDTKCLDEAKGVSQRPAPNAVRSALLIRACDEVLTFDRAVQNALGKVQRTTASPLDLQATKDLYELFYPGKTMSPALAQVINTYTQGLTQLTQIDHWRFQLHLLCSAGEWENL